NSVINLQARGYSDENLSFNCYLKENNEISERPIFSDLERYEPGTISHKKGKVLISDDNRAGFRILIRECYTGWPGPALGMVVSGMDVLQRIIDHNLASEYDNTKSQYTSSQVIISESGLVIEDQLV
ncbi:unnamed protein product, partial [Meganyctiphanes norvegica]